VVSGDVQKGLTLQLAESFEGKMCGKGKQGMATSPSKPTREQHKGHWRCSSGVKHLPSVHEALGSISGIAKNKTKTNKQRQVKTRTAQG
jgi:hypothetical protein